MKLLDLEPQFLRRADSGHRLDHVDELAEAQGIWFDCPAGDGHKVLVWFVDRGVPPEAAPTYRWRVSGTGYLDLTISPSINLDVPGAVGCRWHGFVVNGEAR
jgi:hypothetical protein